MSLLFLAIWVFVACGFMLAGACFENDILGKIGALMALFSCAFVC